jgi:hypothetical protein
MPPEQNQPRPYGMPGHDADTFRQMSRVEVKDRDHKEGHVRSLIHEKFEPLFAEVLSAGNLSFNQQRAMVRRAILTMEGAQQSIPIEYYRITTLGDLIGALSLVIVKVSQSGQGENNLLRRMKTWFNISEAKSRHEESLQAKGRLSR